MLGAIGAAEDFAVGFDAVADYTAIAMWADRRHGVDCAFKTVECHGLSALRNLKGLIVIVAADVTLGHRKLHHQRFGNTIAKEALGSLVLARNLPTLRFDRQAIAAPARDGSQYSNPGGGNKGRPDGRWCRMAV